MPDDVPDPFVLIFLEPKLPEPDESEEGDE
jgi:hypothetical protein